MYHWSWSHGLWSQIPALWSLIPSKERFGKESDPHSFDWANQALVKIACEQALPFGRAKQVARERASERKSREGPRKRELATISHKYWFVLRSDEGKYHWLKNDFPEIKVDWLQASWPALNFRRNVETRCSYRQKPSYVGNSWTYSEWRPAEEENRFLLLWEITVVCVSNWFSGGSYWNQEFLSALKADGLVCCDSRILDLRVKELDCQ